MRRVRPGAGRPAASPGAREAGDPGGDAARREGGRGFGVAELLVGATIGLLVLGALTAALGAGGRLLLGTGLRLEADDVAVSAAEALAFDVRRAGWDPAAAGVEPLPGAAADGLTVEADLDGDGSIDATSEERVRWACLGGPPRLSRIVGVQSMPVANAVVACAFAYLDADGAPVPDPGGGLDAAARAAVRAVVLDVAVQPPGLTAAVARRTTVALRSVP